MKIIEMTPEGLEWIASRPPVIQAMIKRCPPEYLYRMKKTGQRVCIRSYEEGGTVSVAVPPEYNPKRVHVGHGVFGVDIDDLERCAENEEEAIAAEAAEMAPIADAMDAMRDFHWSPEGIEASREFIRRQRSKS